MTIAICVTCKHEIMKRIARLYNRILAEMYGQYGGIVHLLRKRGTSLLSGSLIFPTVTGAPVGLDRYMLICNIDTIGLEPRAAPFLNGSLVEEFLT